MKALIQRVQQASVSVNDQTIGKIGVGILVYLGITHGDSENEIKYLHEKIINLRIFENEEGKLDKSLLEVNGSILLVSQFTLYGTADKGRRPDFGLAAPTQEAKAMYEKAVEIFKSSNIKVETGQFQAHMFVESTNDGPFTLMLESKAK
jgi:D-tyrosyl-tRNA(Tyr) deacylase